jgi:hypothetical protein
VTAPLVLLGLRQPTESNPRSLPSIVRQGHELITRFSACHGTLSCREIRGDARVPLRCVGVVQQAPGLYARTLQSEGTNALSPEQEEAYGLFYAHWVDGGFHCAHSVFRAVGDARFEGEALRAASSAFVGGTVLTGGTCSALTAGVMALGLALGTIENSRPRVLRLIATMAVGGDAFADSLNDFNKIMNLGHELARWFKTEFGSTSCRTLTHCDLCTKQDFRRYIENDGITRCRAIAEAVAHRVQELILEREASME